MAQRLKTDWILFGTVLTMMCLGLVIVYSASSVVAELRYQWSPHYFVRQLGWAVVSVLLLMSLKRFDYRRLHGPVWAFTGLGVVVALLVLVYFLDSTTHRWLRFGPANLQPSELAKPALVIFLASFLAHRIRVVNSRHTLLPAALALGLVAGVVGVADLGTALVLVATAVTMLYVAGMKLRYFALASVAGLVFAAVAVTAQPYRLRRVVGFLDPEHKLLDHLDRSGRVKEYMQSTLSTRDTSYQAKQSRIAVGTGGVLGVGLTHGRQKLLYLPEAHTDFIYAVVGEELGLLGATVVLVGFLIICWRGLRLVWLSTDDFGRLLALGITSYVVVQALINMTVVLDLGPTKGIPLPLISYGGSSLLATLLSMGLLLSVSERSG